MQSSTSFSATGLRPRPINRSGSDMAGTDQTIRDENSLNEAAPAIILVAPQLGENIGMAARAMLNCGLTDLRLVSPRDGWPNEAARPAAAGAGLVLESAHVFTTTAAAVADLTLVFASTARPRDMTKETVSPREAAARLHKAAAAGGRCGVLFGREAMGLANDDVALADAILSAPLNPGFSSLNLAQAVFAVGYEWLMAGLDVVSSELMMPKDTRPATKEELAGLFEHLERELDACGFLHVAEKRPVMVRNLRNLFQRAGLSEQEVRTLRGVISGLVKGSRD